MKLRTVIVPSDGWRAGVQYTVECGYDTDHDAACAHALMLAMDQIEGTYADCSTAEDIRTFLNERASEIMAGWGFDSGEAEE